MPVLKFDFSFNKIHSTFFLCSYKLMPIFRTKFRSKINRLKSLLHTTVYFLNEQKYFKTA